MNGINANNIYLNKSSKRNNKKLCRNQIITQERKCYKKRRRHKLWKKKKRKEIILYKTKNKQFRKTFPDYVKILAPKHFSLVHNEVQTTNFLKKLRHHYELRHKVFVVLKSLESVSTDAIVVLLSTMVDFRIARIAFNGNKPKNDKVREKLETSGFFDYLWNDFQINDDQKEYTFKNLSNRIYTHGQKTVASKTADNIVKYASMSIWNEARRCPGVQKTLLELMHNTFDHADRTKGKKNWWISVEHDKERKEVIFSFIDFGIGIFRSIENKKENDPLYGLKEYFKNFFPYAKTQVEKLKLMLEGKVKMTQSKEYYRGQGLAKIYKHYEDNKISSLVVISNRAYINTETNDFHSLKNEFKGTFISWKINSETVSLKWEI